MAHAQLIAILHEDTERGGYWAEVPFMYGCLAEGDTLEETLENITEATTGVLEDMMDRVREGNAPGFPSLPEGFSVDSAEQGREYGEAVLANYLAVKEMFVSAGITEPVSATIPNIPNALIRMLDVRTLDKEAQAVPS